MPSKNNNILEIQPISISPNDLELLKYQKYMEELQNRIILGFNIPPHIFSVIETGYYEHKK